VFVCVYVDMSGVKDQLAMVDQSSSGNDQSSSVSNKADEYSKCEKREEAPLILHAPSDPPAAISYFSDKPVNVLSSAVANPTADEGAQQALLASGAFDTSDNESEQSSESAFTEHVNGHDAADEEYNVDQDDNNDDNDNDDDDDGGGGGGIADGGDEEIYRPASQLVNSATDHTYMMAQMLDVNSANSLPNVFEPTSNDASTSGGYSLARVVLDAGTDLLGSGAADVDYSLEGNSSESAATEDDSQESPDSGSKYCAVEFFTNTTRDE